MPPSPKRPPTFEPCGLASKHSKLDQERGMGLPHYLLDLWNFLVRHRAEIFGLTLEHVWLVGWSMLFAVAIGLPLGVLLTRRPRLDKPILGTARVIQTIPSLAP